MGDGALGVVTRTSISAAHPSPTNKKFVEAFKKANKGVRPNFMAVSGYDGMRVHLRGAQDDQRPGRRRRAAGSASKGRSGKARAARCSSTPQHARRRARRLHPRKRRAAGTASCYNVEFDAIKDVKDPGTHK
jgi:branched-chain amino acid transport system substrate-binding protein